MSGAGLDTSANIRKRMIPTALETTREAIILARLPLAAATRTLLTRIGITSIRRLALKQIQLQHRVVLAVVVKVE
jgi:hypothetical protein